MDKSAERFKFLSIVREFHSELKRATKLGMLDEIESELSPNLVKNVCDGVKKISELRTFPISPTIQFGMTREEVVDVLGEPNDKGGGSNKYPTPDIFRYGKLDFIFESYQHGRLLQIRAANISDKELL